MPDQPVARRTVVRAAGAVAAGAAGAGALAACGGSSTPSTGSGGAAAPSTSSSTSSSASSASSSSTSTGGSTTSAGSSTSAAPSGPSVKTADVPVGGGVVKGDQGFVVTQPTAGQFKAFSSVCTHQGCTLNKVEAGVIKCPCHQSQFDITSGAPKGGPATKPLGTKTATVNGDSVVIT